MPWLLQLDAQLTRALVLAQNSAISGVSPRPRFNAYRFFVHRERSAYRLVLHDDGRLPDGTRESEWQLTRLRDGGDVNADVVGEIAARG